MDSTRLLAETRGFFTRAEAVDLGVSDQQLTNGVRQRVLLRVRTGYYTYVDLWDPLDAVERHRIRCRCVMHSLGNDHVALSHTSGAILHGMTTWGVDLDRVHVTRLDRGSGRIEGDVVHHVGRSVRGNLTEKEGLRVLGADRCAVEAGSLGSAESALVVFDSFLHRQAGAHDDLFAQFMAMAHWPSTQHLHLPIRMADGGADGPGESRGRWLCRTFGLPVPETQFVVSDTDGVVRGTCDWGWPEQSALGEFDGKVKYGRLLHSGQSAGDVVFAEKQREDLLRELTGWSMTRLVWSDYERPRVTAQRIGRALGMAPRLLDWRPPA